MTDDGNGFSNGFDSGHGNGFGVFGNVAALLSAMGSPTQHGLVALSFYRGRALIGRVTYTELVAQVIRFSGYLEQALGVRSGDRILILSPNRLEIPVVLLSIWHLGAVAVPLNPNALPEDWDYIARHCQARGLIGTQELRRLAGKSELDFSLDIEELATFSSSPAPSIQNTGQDLGAAPAIVLYTSGTTGNPKGVELSQSGLLCNAWSMALNFGFRRSTQFAVLPLYHAHALGFGLMTSLTTGGHLVFTDKLDPFAWAEVIRAESVSFTSVVPSLLPLLLAARVHRDKVPTLRSILVSSAPLTSEAAREFEAKTQILLIQGWGLSEYTNFACCLSPGDTASDHEALLLGSEVPSVGGALSGTEVKVVDGAGQLAGEGVSGELCVRGHSLMLGYYRDLEATKNVVVEGWLRTGDQGMYRLRGGKPVFFVTGRIKEIIIRDGDKYSPLAIEKKISEAMPELQGKFVVLGFAHRSHGEEIGAYVEADGLAADLKARWQPRFASVVATLPVEMRPKVVLFGKTPIPRTHTGKIQRRKLQPLFAGFQDHKGLMEFRAV